MRRFHDPTASLSAVPPGLFAASAAAISNSALTGCLARGPSA